MISRIILQGSLLYALASASRLATTQAPPAITQAPDVACPPASSMPPCGIGCLASAANAAGCPDLLNFGCQCKVAPQISSLASSCVLDSCGAATATIVDSVGDAICSQCVL
ncbi:hypothetical protein BT67DRAFT_444418 [Trichocladium antarcticum]|uniref:CFEM domain-containing protein n=1 Tax=Trichocladium antarcticum TaxID=1450529 RepID=A0AAN6UEN5_9PEZI|nr:hypothetical protein BT67DRAFT_444418 [Trichocladium antarcticum]